jgi:hypothetical protein
MLRHFIRFAERSIDRSYLLYFCEARYMYGASFLYVGFKNGRHQTYP